jgi:uncharacterized membrane protein HdeD (DUF308 family)
MTTTVIAQVLGIFFAVTGISMVVNTKGTAAAMEASVQNKGILWLWGMLALLIGAVIVVMNNTWTSGLPLLVHCTVNSLPVVWRPLGRVRQR